MDAIYSYLLHLFSALLMVGGFVSIYMWVTPFQELALIRQGIVAPALSLGGAAIALAIYLVRRKPAPAPAPAPQAGYGSPATAGSGLSGPQTFGTDVSAAPASGQAPYGQAPGSGLGGYWCRMPSLSCLGHQSAFDGAPAVACLRA